LELQPTIIGWKEIMSGKFKKQNENFGGK